MAQAPQILVSIVLTPEPIGAVTFTATVLIVMLAGSQPLVHFPLAPPTPKTAHLMHSATAGPLQSSQPSAHRRQIPS